MRRLSLVGAALADGGSRGTLVPGSCRAGLDDLHARRRADPERQMRRRATAPAKSRRWRSSPIRTRGRTRASIKEKVASRQMPPWFADKSVGTFANDPSLTDAEIATIARWVDAGAPQGDPKDMPKPPQFTDGWQLGEPDQIIELPEIQIPATGGDYFPTPNLDAAI